MKPEHSQLLAPNHDHSSTTSTTHMDARRQLHFHLIIEASHLWVLSAAGLNPRDDRIGCV
jgi:hypothetical protein